MSVTLEKTFSHENPRFPELGDRTEREFLRGATIPELEKELDDAQHELHYFQAAGDLPYTIKICQDWVFALTDEISLREDWNSQYLAGLVTAMAKYGHTTIGGHK